MALSEQNTVKFTQSCCSKHVLCVLFSPHFYVKDLFVSFGDSEVNKTEYAPSMSLWRQHWSPFQSFKKTPFYRSVAQKLHFLSLLMELRISPSHASHFLPLRLHHDINFTTYIFLACFLSEKAHLYANALTGGEKNCTWGNPRVSFPECFRVRVSGEPTLDRT